MKKGPAVKGLGKKVKDLMVDEVLTIDASATLTDASRRMREGNVGALPVLSDGRLCGMITDRDIVVRALAFGRDPDTTRVGECATADVVCAHPDTTVEDAREVMADCQVGRLPVVDDHDRVIGMVTLSSLALRGRDQLEALHTAQAVSLRSARAA